MAKGSAFGKPDLLRPKIEELSYQYGSIQLDFAAQKSVCRAMHEAAEPERDDLIPRLFALLTAQCEDGAAIAAQGQGRGLCATRHRELAHRLEDIGEGIATIAQAASALSEAARKPPAAPPIGRHNA